MTMMDPSVFSPLTFSHPDVLTNRFWTSVGLHLKTYLDQGPRRGVDGGMAADVRSTVLPWRALNDK